MVGATGIEGTVAHKIEAAALGALYPNEFLDSTLNAYVVPALRLVAV